MERLTKRISGYAHGAEGRSLDNLTGFYCRGRFEATACVEKLAEYEDAEENGMLVRLPVAVGSTIYEPRPDRGSLISVYEVTRAEITNHSIWYGWRLIDGIYSRVDGFCADWIG